MAQKLTFVLSQKCTKVFSISLEYRLMPFCTFVGNRKYENKQSENAEDKISAEFRKFSPYFIIEILGMRMYFITNCHSWELAS